MVVMLSALPASTYATDVSIYGRASLSVQSSDAGDGSFTEVKSNASRIGFKGGHELSEGLNIIYKAEFQVDLDGDSEKGKSITDRSQYIGLKGNFGEILIGNNDTMLKQSQGKVDIFSDLNGDLKHLWKGDNRMSDTISYKSPKFSGFQIGVTYVAEDSSEGDSASSIAVFYGDKKLKKSKVYAALAVDSDVKGYDTSRASVQGKFSGITLGAIFQTQKKLSTGTELDGMLFSAKYALDKIIIKGQFQTAEEDGGDDKSSFTLGADYKMAKSTKIYTFFTSLDMDSDVDQSYLGVGLEYNF